MKLCLCCILALVYSQLLSAEEKPLAVFVIGTNHYNFGTTMPEVAKQLQSLGFRTAVVSAPENPERNKNGIPGLEVLKRADVAIFCVRFLTIPDDQLKIVNEYVAAGKPVVGIRTSTHAFAYPANDSRSVWNEGFGKDVLGAKYLTHLEGTTRIEMAAGAEQHPILAGVGAVNWSDPGTLYIVEPAQDLRPLLTGIAKSNRTGTVTNDFGTFTLQETMKQAVAWTWTNKYGGRAFATTLGHPESFANTNFVRFLVNGIHWAAGRAIPPPATPIAPIVASEEKSVKVAAKSQSDVSVVQISENSAELSKFGIYGKSEPFPKPTEPLETSLPLKLNPGDRIAFIGNTLFEREQAYGFIETLIQQRFPNHHLAFRNLSWSADTIDLQPRPQNFATTEQHLTRERADVILAAFGFNESFAGESGIPAFREKLAQYVDGLKTKAFNGRNAARIVLVSPIANENVPGVPAADFNNDRIAVYVEAMRAVAAEKHIGFADVFTPMKKAISAADAPLTFNGVHLEQTGYLVFAKALFSELFGEAAPPVNSALQSAVQDKDKQFFRRFRPLNTFYYTGERSTTFGYLDFLPAMRSFDIMVANRDERIWALAAGEISSSPVNDSNVPAMPKPSMNKAVNSWKSAAEEQKCFKLDPRFEVNLFAGEEQFPELANPIQMRWDSRGRLWVSCSTTYPHSYPGCEPNDRIIVLEDTNGDGKADKLTVFADHLSLPLSFEFGDGGVYVSEQPNLTFLKDTDGDGKADLRRTVLSGFGTEDSHHALHDFTWTPDGALLFRESIFHHSQIETPYGPVRMQNSGWFRFEPHTHRLIAFGSYPSTNPWGVAFDRWGQHVASHPIYAEAFHALNPPYPEQHAAPTGLNGYSGTCGHVFVDVPTFPREMQGNVLKNRYKPTNRVEIHRWNEQAFGYDESYVGDLLFSTDLCFIPVDIKFGPRGDLYICDWYNPVKGHAQYALRDERRDHKSGRIWRITQKQSGLAVPRDVAGASTSDLLNLLKCTESYYRDHARRELGERDPAEVKSDLDKWISLLDHNDPDFRHHQLEALWVDQSINSPNALLLRELLSCEDPHARAAAAQQLPHFNSPDCISLLRSAANDSSAIVRMHAAIAASYIGTKEALDAALDIAKYPQEKHLAYAFRCALQSESLRRLWEGKPEYANIRTLLETKSSDDEFTERKISQSDKIFDSQKNLTQFRIECVPDQMRFSQTRIIVNSGQPVKLTFVNPDANDHNLVIVKPDALDEVGMAANAMASDPKNANSDFIPEDKKHLIIQHSPMIGPNRAKKMQVLRFKAPEPGIYPYVCTFPGHWVAMTGEMLVVDGSHDVNALLAARKAAEFVKEWKLEDFRDEFQRTTSRDLMRGMKVFVSAKCITCHTVDKHGAKIGPDLTKVSEKYKGVKLLQQVLEPSAEIHESFRTLQIRTKDGQTFVGTFVSEDERTIKLRTNLLESEKITQIQKTDVEKRVFIKASSMPEGLLNYSSKEEILDLIFFLESGGCHAKAELKREQ